MKNLINTARSRTQHENAMKAKLLTESFFLGVLLRHGTNGQHAGEDPHNAPLEGRLLGSSILDHGEAVEETMCEVEKTHDLVVVGGYRGKRLGALSETNIVVSVPTGVSYLHDLSKGRENQAGWHCGGKRLFTIGVSIDI